MTIPWPWEILFLPDISLTAMNPVLMLLTGVISESIWKKKYRQVSNISRTLGGNKIVDHSDVVGASPVGAAPTTSSFST